MPSCMPPTAGIGRGIERERLAERLRILAEKPLPSRIAENDDIVGARRLVRRL